MKFSIISPENKQEFDDIKSVTFPGFWGELQILPGHAESFIVLQQGEVVIENTEFNALTVKNGSTCHIKDDNVVILV